MKQPRAIFAALLALPLILGSGYFAGQLLRGYRPGLRFNVAIIPVVILATWLAIVWHECGHAIAGALAGFHLRRFAVGPLLIERDLGGPLHFRFNRALSMWGGYYASSPGPALRNGVHELSGKMLWMIAGGPIASFLGGVPLVFGVNALGFFGFTSLCLAIATSIPSSHAGLASDGKRILQLLRRDAAGRQWITVATLGTLAQELRPRDWPSQLLLEQSQEYCGPSLVGGRGSEPRRDREGAVYETGESSESIEAPPALAPDAILLMWMRFSWHLDRGEISDAQHCLEEALAAVDQLPAIHQPYLHASAVDFYSRVLLDLPRAQAHWRSASKPGTPLPTEVLASAHASLLIAEGKFSEARAAIAQSRPLLNTLTGSSRQYFDELLTELEAKAVHPAR